MATKTALITGASGFLGRQVFKAFQSAGFRTIGTGYTRAAPPSILKIDLTDESAVTDLFKELLPDVVVHCAANRYPDKCDQDPEGATRINVQATKFLAQTCLSHGASLIYISTDYVFSGTPGDAPYESTATVGPPNLYGRSKLEGERAVQAAAQSESSGHAIILRVPVLYGSAQSPEESAINTLLKTVWMGQEKHAKIEMDHWARRYPTNTEDVARVCVDLYYHISQSAGLHSSRAQTIFQFSSEDCYTKFQICSIFADILGLPLAGIVANTTGNDPHASVQRPFDTHLSTRALREAGINVDTQNFEEFWRREIGAHRK